MNAVDMVELAPPQLDTEGMNATLEQLRDALIESTDSSLDFVAHALLPNLMKAVDTSAEAVEQLVTFVKELFAALPSTSANVDITYGSELAGVQAEDLALPPGPISALQELIIDAYDVAFWLLSDHASSEAKVAESAVLSKKKESEKARSEAEDAARLASKSKTPDAQARAEALRQALVKANEELNAARQEQTRTKIDSGLTPETARVKALIGFLSGLQDVLPAPLLKIRLDPTALVTVGVMDASRTKAEPRARAAKFYKQQYFNLLREETEGYAKLVVELLSNMGPPHDAATGRPSEPPEVCQARAEVVMTNIKSLIGYFDLHPHRALDIVLDVFSDHVIAHHTFFRRLLALSPWAEQGQHNVQMDVDGPVGSREKGSNQIASILGFKFAFYQAPEGPSEAPYRLYYMAAILIWDGLVAMPDIYSHVCLSVVFLGATFEVIQLSLSEETLRAAQNAQAQAARGKLRSRTNALTMAGALDGPKLGSATAASSISKSAASVDTAKSKDPQNQKLALMTALFGIGDVAHAMFILSRYPYLINGHPTLVEELLRIADALIDPAYRALPLSWRRTSSDRSSEARGTDTAGHRRPRWSLSEKKLARPSAPRSTLSAHAFTRSTADAPLVFFFPDWQDRLPKPSTPEDSIQETLKMLRYIGALSARNLRFFHKLIRIGADTVERAIAAGDEATRLLWRDILRKHILPGMSLAEANTGLTFALWHLLRLYSYQERFSMYGEWSTVSYNASSALREKQAEAEQESKSILKRLSSDNTRQSARAMAKIAHSNPCIFFSNALNQIQSYQNMISPVVESARYLSDVGYDVINYVLIESLSRDKDRTKADGTNTADWLINLSDFAGQLFRRYDVRMDPILRYILAQITQDNVQDLVILRSLLGDMTEVKVIDPLTVSDDQVKLLGGSALLRSHVMTSLITEAQITAQDRKFNLKALRRWDEQVASKPYCQQLVVRIAICRQQCIDRMSEPEASQVQSIASIYDQTHLILCQLANYLELHHATSYEEHVPPLWDLVERYGLDAAAAFHLARPVIRRELSALPKVVAKKLDSAKEASDLDVLRQKVQAAKAARAAKSDGNSNSLPLSNDDGQTEKVVEEPLQPVTSELVDVMKIDADVATAQTDETASAVESTIPHELTGASLTAANEETVVSQIDEPAPSASEPNGQQAPPAVADANAIQADAVGSQTMVTDGDVAASVGEADAEQPVAAPDQRQPYLEWLKISLRFDSGHTALWYLTFWELTLYDISAPIDGYSALIKTLDNAGPTLQNQIMDLEDRTRMPPIGTTEQQRQAFTKDLKREITKIRASLPRIAERLPVIRRDEKEQIDHVARVIDRLNREKALWVLPGKTTAFSRFLINNCVRLRAPFSPVDALFCGHLILLLHRIGTPDFNFMWICEQIFCDSLTAIVAASTEQEARNYAYFLSVMFGHCRKWAQGDEATYNKEAIGEGEQRLPGMLETSGRGGTTSKHWSHDRFRRCVYKYEAKVLSSLRICLSGPIEHARNGLRTLIQLIDVFPIHSNVGEELEALAKTLTSKDPSIKVLAEGYIAALSKRRSTWARPFSAGASLSAKAAPFAPPAKAATPEPVDRKNATNLSSSSRDIEEQLIPNGIKTDKMEDVKHHADTPPLTDLPVRPAVDPNWREKEQARKVSTDGRGTPTAMDRPSGPSRQPSENLRQLDTKASTPPPTGNLRERLSKPLAGAATGLGRLREAERSREDPAERPSVLAPRDQVSERPASRASHRDSSMPPPSAPTGPRVPISPRNGHDVHQSPNGLRTRADTDASPRAPRIERQREREMNEADRDEARLASRHGSPDSTHSSSHRSSHRRAETPVEGSSSSRRHTEHRSRGDHRDDRNRDRDRDRERPSSRHHSERGHSSSRHEKDRPRRDRDKDRERDKERDRRKASGSEKRVADDDSDYSSKRRRTASPPRDVESSRPLEPPSRLRESRGDDTRPEAGTSGDGPPPDQPVGLTLRGYSKDIRDNPGRRFLNKAMAETQGSRDGRSSDKSDKRYRR